MIMFGLDDRTIQSIRSIFKKHKGIKEVKVFGSRALGTHRANSDIDLALFGQIDWELTRRVQSQLDVLSTPYKFDVISYSLIEHPPLKEHIDRVGKVFK